MNASSTQHQLGRQRRDGLIDSFAAVLDEQRRFRTEQIAQHWTHEASRRAETVAEREVREVLFRGAVAALNDINAAIERIADGTFGRCTHCHQDIPLERLEILPQSAHCLACERAR